jgi:protein gp37
MARVGKEAAGRELDGREWSEFPVQESPATA